MVPESSQPHPTAATRSLPLSPGPDDPAEDLSTQPRGLASASPAEVLAEQVADAMGREVPELLPNLRVAESSSSPEPDAEPLPARMINEFVYCPRLFYYEFVEGVFVHNADTLHGAAIHQKVDSGNGALPAAKRRGKAASNAATAAPTPQPDVIHSRSVSLGSDRLGVTAKLDLVEVRDPSDGLFDAPQVIPVDYKAGRPREDADGTLTLWDADKVQLGLQILLLRDNGYACAEGVIYYRQTKQRVKLLMTAELEAWVVDQIAGARRCAAGPIPAPLVDSPKCPRCSLVSVCLPDETRLLAHPPAEPEAAEVRRLITARAEARAVYINAQGATAGKSGQTMEIRERDGKTLKAKGAIPLRDVSHVAVFGNNQLTTGLIQELCQQETPISYFSASGWFYGITRGHDLTNVFTRIRQFAVAADPAASLLLSRAMVAGKIRNQRTLLMRNHVEPPAAVLLRLQRAAKDDCAGASSRETLLGIEGAAAALYFQHFAGMVKTGAGNASGPPDLDGMEGAVREASPDGAPPLTFDFQRRNRRPPRDPVNALLSLAYSLLAKDCTLAATAVGFDPYVGFLHQPRYGRPALALDLMEEFRPIVADSAVLTAINNNVLQPRDFVRAGDSVNLSPKGRAKFFETYERRINTTVTHPVFGYQVSYRRALELQFRMLARVLTGEIPEYVPFLTR